MRACVCVCQGERTSGPFSCCVIEAVGALQLAFHSFGGGLEETREQQIIRLLREIRRFIHRTRFSSVWAGSPLATGPLQLLPISD